MAVKTRIELEIDESFQDITADVRFAEPISIARGRRDWASNVDPSSCKLRINNRESEVVPGVFGRYSPRNPRSDLYGKIGRNTPIRVRTGPGALVLGAVEGDFASTPDAAKFRITGDIDLRADITPEHWFAEADAQGRQYFVAKWGISIAERSYFLGVEDERIRLAWSEDGTIIQDALSSIQVPIADNKRLAVRATLETSFKGLEAHRITFYTAPTINGPWTQFGAAETREGSTSILSGTSDLEVGTLDEGLAANLAGGVHAVEVRDGIDGTVVANPFFDDLDDGTLSFTDDSDNEWSINGGAEIDEVFHIRFVGEVSSWPLRWNLADTDITTPITASGVFRRMQQGFAPLRSTMYEYLTDNDENMVAYWPMEEVDEKLGNRLRSFIPIDPDNFNPDLRRIYGVDFRFTDADSGGFGEFVGADPVLSFGDESFASANIPGYENSGQFLSACLFRLNSGNVLTQSDEVRYIQWHNLETGIGHLGRIAIESDSNGLLNIGLFEGETPAAVIHRGASLEPSVFDKNILIYIYIEQDGSDVNYEWGWFSEDGLSATESDTILSYDFQAWDAVDSRHIMGSTSGWAIGHFVAFDGIGPDSIIPDLAAGPFLGWKGETVVERIQRLGGKLDLDVAIVGEDDTPRMGPQTARNAFEDMRASGKVDLGFFGERQTAVGVRYRTRGTRYNQHPLISLDYEEGLISEPFQPIEDDQEIVNDFVASREDGGDARFTETEGPLSIQPPPDGVGIYSGSDTLNVEDDAQLSGQAAWRVHLGTSDELRFPTMRLNLSAPRVNEIAGAILSLDEVDRVQVENPPDWLPAKSIDLIVEGWQEEIDTVNHIIEFNATPAEPWTIGRDDSSVDDVGLILFTEGELNFADTPDSPELRITGDISLRADLSLDTFPPDNDTTVVAKYDDTDALRSYRIDILSSGVVRLRWSIDGTSATLETIDSFDAAVSADGARFAIRADLDADDGSGGHEVTFYQAETIAGPWNEIFGPGAQAGTTSIFAGAADLEVGARDNGSREQTLGTIHAVEVWDGLGDDEELVADPRFAAQEEGTEVFTDGSGNQWSLQGVAYIENLPGRESSEPIRYAPTAAILERDIAEADENISVASEPPYWTTDGVPMPFDIVVGGEVMKVRNIGPGLFDEFERTETNGWGTTPTDHEWIIDAFDGASAFSVSGGVASVENATEQENNKALIDDDLTDAEVLMRARLPGGIPGGTVETNIHLRVDPASAHDDETAYQFLLGWTSGGDVITHIGLLDGGSFTNITGNITIGSFSAGEWFFIRAQVMNGSLRSKVWRESDDEPEAWSLITLDDTLTSGRIGVKSRLGAGSGTPLATEFECFDAVSVQGFDVDRSVNGVEKPHSGGDEVDLNVPARYAL